MQVDEIVVISLVEDTERQASVRSQMPRDASWRFHFAERDPDGGRAGCYRSHAEVLRSAQERGLRRVLILEDDFRLLFEWAEVVRLANVALGEVEREDPEWSFLLVGMHAVNIEHPSSAVRRVKCASGTHAYIANIAHAGLPLPAYRGQHIDQLLFCDYYCTKDRPAGLPDETFGANALIVSIATSEIGETCSTRGRHVFATNPVLVHINPGKSNVNDLHALFFHAEELVGPERLATFSTLFGLGAATIIGYYAVFAVAVCIGATVALRWPAMNMNLFIAAIVALNAVIFVAGDYSATIKCAYPCYFLWRMDLITSLVAFSCLAAAIMYVLVSARRAVRFADLIWVMLYTGGLFALAVTVNTDQAHKFATVVAAIGAFGITWTLFKPFFALAIMFVFGLNFLVVGALESLDIIIHAATGEKPPSLRQETTDENDRCVAAKASLIAWLFKYGIITACALAPITWREDVFLARRLPS